MPHFLKGSSKQQLPQGSQFCLSQRASHILYCCSCPQHELTLTFDWVLGPSVLGFFGVGQLRSMAKSFVNCHFKIDVIADSGCVGERQCRY